MTTPPKARILVVGATGAQGGSVARHLLAHGWDVRAVTRDVGSPKARALVALAEGASGRLEWLRADLGDLGALVAAMRDCAAVFGVTNYGEHFGIEITHGKNLVDAAQRAGVGHLILSTLPAPELLSGGELTVPHMDSKAAIERYARASGLRATFVHVACYFENFLSRFLPRPDPQGVLRLGFPLGDASLPGVAVEDLGPVVRGLLAERARYLDATVAVVGDQLTGAQYARVLSRILERDVRYAHVERASYAQLPFEGAAELAAMFDFTRRFAPALEITRHTLDFAAWAAKHAAVLRNAWAHPKQ